MKKILLILITIIFNLVSFCYALETDTHQEINKYIAKNTLNGFLLDSYLKNQLGIQAGIEEKFNSQEVWWWIQKGGLYEDVPYWWMPYLRSVNHFHNPLTDQGFSGIWGTGVLSGVSSIQWSQKPKGTQSPGGYYSWHDARDYFYKGLTANDKTTRETNFADTFRGMGQLMHLIEDASVPAHTRNDGHLFYNYENFAESYINEHGVPTPLPSDFFGGVITNIASFIDTNQYTGNNPTITANNNTIGLSEYTNANFFSEDTINSSNFTYPQIESMPIVERNFTNTLWNTTYPREYYLKNCCGETNSGQGYLLAAVDYLDYYRQQYPALSFALPKIPVLDDNIYADYASLLIPRAVGYSAGLLNYFFRGDLYITLLVPSTDYVGFDFHNQNDTGSNIDTVAVFIQNNSKLNNVIEPIGTGTLTLTVSYKDSFGTTFYEPAINSISITQIPEIGSASYFAALFTLTSPISTQTAQDITYYFAFRGQLGNETDAVIGKVVKGPVLYNVVPDNGLEGDVVTLTGNNLPIINGPFPTILNDNASDVRFNHDLTPYTTEVINRTNTDITVKVPNTASLKKPGYGGLRVRNVLDTGEKIYSNPISFFPIAEGEVRNTGQAIVNVTIEATKPIVGDYSPLPQTITINNLSPGVSAPIQLITGFTYKATANTTVTKDIYLLTSNVIDFVFEVQ